MLPAGQRLTSGESFRTVVRRGVRAGSRTVVLHLHAAADDLPSQAPTRAGFVVSKAVGPAVVRNRVKRRLRHLVRGRLDRVPAGCELVVRAQPAAAAASAQELGGDLDRCLDRVLRDLGTGAEGA